MNYFSKIKPVLNKLSELNVYDSLEMVRAYMQASAKVTELLCLQLEKLPLIAEHALEMVSF